MRHTPRRELIRRRQAGDPLQPLEARHLRRTGLRHLVLLRVLVAWLRRRSRLRSRGRRVLPNRRYAVSVLEHWLRSERLERVCRERPGRPAERVRIRWVVAGAGEPYSHDMLLPVRCRARR